MESAKFPIDDKVWKEISPSVQEIIFSLWMEVQGLKAEIVALQDRSKPEQTPAEQHEQSPYVLVVDDSVPARKMVCQIVEETGCRAVEAENGQQGLRAVKEQRPDLIIMDVNMPRKGGIDTLRALRRDENYKSIDVVMLTCDANRKTLAQVATEQVSGYIIKGTRDEIRKRLAPYLEKTASQLFNLTAGKLGGC